MQQRSRNPTESLLHWEFHTRKVCSSWNESEEEAGEGNDQRREEKDKKRGGDEERWLEFNERKKRGEE